MALLDWIGCDLRDTGEFDASVAGSGGSISFITSSLYAGTGAVRLEGGGTGTSVTLSWTARSTLTVRALLRIAGDTGTPISEVLRIMPAVGGQAVRCLWSNPDSKLTLEADNGLGTWPTVLATHDWTGLIGTAEWLFVEISLDDAGGANKWWIRSQVLGVLNADKTSEGTHANIVATWEGIRFFAENLSFLSVNQILLDGAYKADLGLHLQVQTLRPSADQQEQWTPSTGTDNFALVDETPPNGDTDYVAATVDGRDDRYEVTDLSIPATGGAASPVKAVAVGFSAKNNVLAGTSQLKGQIRDSAGALIQDGSDATASSAAYQLFRGNARSVADRTIAAVNGFRAGIVSNVDVAGNELRCSAVWMTAVIDAAASVADTAVGTHPAETLDRIGAPEAAVGADVSAALDRTGDGDVAVGVEPDIAHSIDLADSDAASGVEGPEDLVHGPDLDTATGVEPAELADRTGDDIAAAVETAETLLDRLDADVAAGVEAAEVTDRADLLETATGVDAADGPTLEGADSALGHDGTSMLVIETPVGYLANEENATGEAAEQHPASADAEASSAGSDAEGAGGSSDVESLGGGFEFEGG